MVNNNLTFMLKISVYIALFLTCYFNSYLLFAAERRPTDIVRDLIKSIGMIKDESVVKLSPEEKKTKQKFIKRANSLIDIPGLGLKTLGPQWEKRTQIEKDIFLSVLTNLFGKVAYPKSSKFFTDLEIKYNDEKVKQGRVEVNTSMEHESEGLIEIDYILHKVNEQWLIYDVVLDGVSLATNLKSQFRRIIIEESYGELIKRMNKRLGKEN